MADIRVTAERVDNRDGSAAAAIVNIRFDGMQTDLDETDARHLHRELARAIRWIDSKQEPQGAVSA